jgi:predicted HD phosphohydrolase
LWGRITAPDAQQDVFRLHATSVYVPRRLSSLGHMNALASWAEHLTQALLQEPLSRRWAHVKGVAARARSLAPALGADADLLQAAAWLHDIGYAPGLTGTGLARPRRRPLPARAMPSTPMPCCAD